MDVRRGNATNIAQQVIYLAREIQRAGTVLNADTIAWKLTSSGCYSIKLGLQRAIRRQQRQHFQVCHLESLGAGQAQYVFVAPPP